jgi:hypothetical protein
MTAPTSKCGVPYKSITCLCINLVPNVINAFLSLFVHFDLIMSSIGRARPKPTLKLHVTLLF